MRKARVSLLAGGSLLTTWRRAVSLAASSGMSVAAPGSSVSREAIPSPSLTLRLLLTSSPQEGRVEAEGDQWFLEPPQKVLEHPTHHMDVSHAAEGRQHTPSPQQLPLPLPHQLLCAWHPVQACLGHRERGSALWEPQHCHLHHPGPYLCQASRLHLGHTLHHQRGHQGRRGGRKVSQHTLGRTMPTCAVPTTQPCSQSGQRPSILGPVAPKPHGDMERPPSTAVPPSPHGARHGGEAWVHRGWGTAPGTWCAAAAGTGST